jgi:hypothetical protein
VGVQSKMAWVNWRWWRKRAEMNVNLCDIFGLLVAFDR